MIHICSSCDRSGLVRLNAPDVVLVVLDTAIPVALGPVPTFPVVEAGTDAVPFVETEVVGLLIAVPVGEIAVTIYYWVPSAQVYVHPLIGVAN